jgi:SAM-dependent methyltransferase
MYDWNKFWTIHKVTKAEAWLISERQAILERCLDALKPGKKAVLEVGCGAASNLRLLKSRRSDAECYALDSSTEAIARVKDEIPNAVLGDCLKAPFEDGKFDLIYSAGLMEHFEDEGLFVREMRRILKDDGRIVTFVPGRYTLWQLHQLFFFTFLSGGYERSYTYGALKAAFENNGFETESTCGLDPFSLQGAVMRVFNISFKPFFTKSPVRSAYTELCLVAKKK